MRCLIVDDEYISRIKLKVLLSEYGDCDAVANGKLAMAMFKEAHKEFVPYDLITMDIDMPDSKGQEIVEEIRKWEDDHHIVASGISEVKIIMISKMKDSANILSSFRKGAESFLRKPFTPEDLHAELLKMELDI